MNTLGKTPALNSGAIFWIFIILSLLAHSLFLMINSTSSTPPAPPKKLSSLEITLQEPSKQQQIAEQKALPAKKTEQQAVVRATPKAAQKSEIIAKVITTPRAEKAISGVQIRMEALQWLQQQANTQFADNAQSKQLVSFGVGHSDSDASYSAYRSSSNSVEVAFNTAAGTVCSQIREADPLDSFDQSIWMVSSNCGALHQRLAF